MQLRVHKRIPLIRRNRRTAYPVVGKNQGNLRCKDSRKLRHTCTIFKRVCSIKKALCVSSVPRKSFMLEAGVGSSKSKNLASQFDVLAIKMNH